MQNIILFGALVLAMFACGHILQRPISKGSEPSGKRAITCVLSAVAIAIVIAPALLPPIMAGWLIVVGVGASMIGVFGPTNMKAVRYALEEAYRIKNSDK